ncbi:glycosyltransferase [Aurantimonas sp. A2-1-M11]|uniref:glycosyltransferase n=1 Tax=Aurantimonas sp. A2-1-M11 TaxID=3113712 RepID=UPI002F929AFB
MAHFALICPPYYSHLQVFAVLGAELVRRGHRVTFVVNAGAGTLLAAKTSAGIAIREAGEGGPDRLAAIIARAARPNGPLGILRTVSDAAGLTDELCRIAPDILREIGATAIVGDQMEPAAGLVADHLGLPFVSVAAALPVHADPTVPLPFLGWPYDPSDKGLKRNRGGECVANLLMTSQRRNIAGWAARFGLAQRATLADCLSPRAQISQLVPGFDFPRAADPHRHAVGPIRPPDDGPPSLPAGLDDRLDPDRPLVFASLGTLQGHRAGIFRAVAGACRDLGAQCVVAHCGRLDGRQAARIDADIVTDFLPQRAMLSRAAICVTHAGMNTVLDCLEAGVPMLAVPIAFDQPGIAARIVHHGVGERLPRVLLSRARIRNSLERLLTTPSFREAAQRIGRDIRESSGTMRATDIIEDVICGTRAGLVGESSI